MEVSEKELLHIANLANLNLKDEEIDTYISHLQDILNFAKVVNKLPVEGLTETIMSNDNYNVFHKDEVKDFEGKNLMMGNAPKKERNMFKIPKVIQ